MKTHLTADLHLGEDRFELINRPFTTKMHMVEYLTTEHNKLVAPDDEVILVGDVCYQNAPEFLPYITGFNGKKTLIRGNHDRVFTDDQLKPYFHTIIAEGDGIEMSIHGLQCYITHYPTMGRPDKFNLVGHIHSAWKFQLNMLNVGVDVNHFRPLDIEKIPFHFKAITDFYDADVWIGYNKTNEQFRGLRGKQTSYFVPKET